MESVNEMNANDMIPEPPQHVVMIADSEALAACARRLAAAPWLVVDTEFLRERTYYAQLCLVQIASADEIALLDTLAIDDLQPLAALMANPDVIKVFHAADQDIEVLQQALGAAPEPVFDTQIAAALAGMDGQISYARMIEDLLDTHLAKTQTRTDWSRRPLSTQALEYAADDVRYLAVAYPMLRDRLCALDRLSWVEADSQALAATASQPVEPGAAWRRLKSWHRLQPAQQQVLAALAEWRENEAMQANRPRKWVLSDDALLALARQQPVAADQLDTIQGVPPKTAKRHGTALLAAIHRGRQRQATPLAAAPQILTDAQKHTLKQTRKQLAAQAQQHDIPAPMLATRKDLEQLVLGQRDVRTLQGWRAAVAGDALLALIDGAG